MHTPRSVVFGVSGISIALELEPRIIDWHKAGKPHGNSVCAIFSFILFTLIDCSECCHTGKMASTTTAKAKRTGQAGEIPPWKHNWQASEQGNRRLSESTAKMFCFLYDSMGAVAHTQERQTARANGKGGKCMVLHMGSSRCNTIGRRTLERIAVCFCLLSFFMFPCCTCYFGRWVGGWVAFMIDCIRIRVSMCPLWRWKTGQQR